MDLIYGQSHATAPVELSGVGGYIGSRYGSKPQIWYAPDRLQAQTYIRGSSVLTGHAADNGVSVCVIGDIHATDTDYSKGDDAGHARAGFLLKRYQSLGLRFLDGLTGHFAVAVTDTANERVLLGADNSGTRTLYYKAAEQPDSIEYGSNIRTLWDNTDAGRELDRSLEDFFLVYGFYPFGRTQYKNVLCVPSGTLIEWRHGKITTHAIESLQSGASYGYLADIGEAAVIDQLHEKFMACLEAQCRDTSSVAVLLGGFDSALVASLLKRLGKAVTTYSFSYDESGYNQPHTDTLARYLGTTHRWVNITPAVIEQGLANYAAVFNQPCVWPNYVIQTDHVCSVIAQDGYTHCYSGDGCDTLFMGYPSVYKRARLLTGSLSLPKTLANLLISLIDHEVVERTFGQTYRIAVNVLRILSRTMPVRGHLTFRVFDETSLKRLRGGEQPVQSQSIDTIIGQLAEGLDGLSPLRLAYLGKSSVSPNKIKLTGSEDHHGLIIHSPYLHPDLKTFAAGIPDHLCRPDDPGDDNANGKYILARMADKKDLLPASVIYQKKLAAIASPIDAWYATSLRPFVESRLGMLPFRIPGRYRDSLLEVHAAEKLYKRYLSSDRVISHCLSLLLTYAGYTAHAGAPSRRSQG